MPCLDVLVTWVWTIESFLFVALAIYGIAISTAESDDTATEVRQQANRSAPNGVLILGLQQYASAGFLKWMHRWAFVHQLAGAIVGGMSLYSLYLAGKTLQAPQVVCEPIDQMLIEFLFLILLNAVCAVQVNLIRVTWSQRRAREDLRMLEMEDSDELKGLWERIQAQMESMRVSAQRERRLAQEERDAAAAARGEATIDQDASEVDRDQALDHRGISDEEGKGPDS